MEPSDFTMDPGVGRGLLAANSDNYDVSVRSWVRADRKGLDAPLADSVAAWLDARWQWNQPDRHGR